MTGWRLLRPANRMVSALVLPVPDGLVELRAQPVSGVRARQQLRVRLARASGDQSPQIGRTLRRKDEGALLRAHLLGQPQKPPADAEGRRRAVVLRFYRRDELGVPRVDPACRLRSASWCSMMATSHSWGTFDLPTTYTPKWISSCFCVPGKLTRT